jgi:AcrR family transcriptional regulator
VTLRERKKKQTRQAILEAANRLFHRDGFDGTTIDDLCDEVDVSRRTFFRYFADKEALLFPHRGERLKRFLGFLAEAPPEENPYDTLRRATRVFALEYQQRHEQFTAQQHLIRSSADLQAREREIDRDWEKALAATFIERADVNTPEAALRAKVIAGASIGVIRATMRHWYDGGGVEDLAQMGLDALESLERGFPLERPAQARPASASTR